MSLIPLNTASTLSTAFSPGEDILFANTSSQAIFTHGDYRIERSGESNALTGTPRNLSFSPFSTLENMGVDDFNPRIFTSVQNNELRPIKSDPNSYSYFGSFYTEVAQAINSILDGFPYAALADGKGVEASIYDYSEQSDLTTGKRSSRFKINSNIIINQGSILFNSGYVAGKISLMSDTNLFEIQMKSPLSAQTKSFSINSYSYHGGAYSSYLEFEVDGHLIGNPSASTSMSPVYIRPSRKRMTEFNIQQSRIERQLLREGVLDIPNVDDVKSNYRYNIPWPRTIDGFNPDSRGSVFEDYKENILLLAGSVDENKTDIMIKTMIPESYLDFDTDNQAYRKFVSSYAKEFDEIKQFIDNIAFAHTIDYNNEESVPEKFLVKLSNLLGWKLSSSFNEIDLFEYLADDSDSNKNSFAHYNVELWKRILININWLYKKKGTRDALQFLFRLMGAPDSLIVFNEFVYEIESTLNNSGISNNKVNQRGFINYDASNYIFQEGGIGRGDGQKYIDQWRPEFNPIKKIDNKKTKVGTTGFTGTENIVNTKELCAAISPANAIEDDIFKWYQSGGTCWNWGTTGGTPFSSNTVPFEYAIPDCELVNPSHISGMTLNEYIDFIYTSNIEPRNRKTNHQNHTVWGYPELKRIYMNYYLMTNPQSNRLTIKKLEPFLELMEVNFRDYLFQLLPATTILECQGTVYRNTVFHRERFIYKEGINRGSEFQVNLPPDLRPKVTPTKLRGNLNDFLYEKINSITINSSISSGIKCKVNAVKLVGLVNGNSLGTKINTWNSSAEVQPGVSFP